MTANGAEGSPEFGHGEVVEKRPAQVAKAVKLALYH
jgi:hypothetical protein